MEVDCKEGSFYIGEWKEDEKDGYGRLVLETGNVYDGEWVDSVAHGKGNNLFSATHRFNFKQALILTTAGLCIKAIFTLMSSTATEKKLIQMESFTKENLSRELKTATEKFTGLPETNMKENLSKIGSKEKVKPP